ncbi:hypothetical protein [Enterococcus gilvus]|uniref:hypothetical protein n=1 Tax=Enterococcus gilvus TaxID=160453 RepID=UPI001C8B32A7|nr:hypothetical protein [Enterococcus gilvus]MBX8938113.1 hypothetical protein [Enterococcus gilvus]
MIKRRKGLSVICMLILVNNFIFSTGSVVVAKTTDENVTEETQLENPLENKLLEESLPEPSATVNTEETLETTEEESPVVEASEPSVPPEATTETQEIETVEETDQSSEVVERKQAPSNEATLDEPKSETGDFTVIGGTINENYTYEDNVLSFKKSGEYQVTGKTSTDRIVVDAADVRLTLRDIKIYLSLSSHYKAALLIAEGASATINLVGENELKSGQHCAGLQNSNSTKDSLVITSDEGKYQGYAGKLTAEGGGSGAGIGGGIYYSSTITINGGEITAIGGGHDPYGNPGGAGIGSGCNRPDKEAVCGEVIINGGNITAIGGFAGGAGIGGGSDGGNGKVIINGGNIVAEGIKEDDVPHVVSAGIGGGSYGNGEVTINGGTSTAIGGFSGWGNHSGSGIGNGEDANEGGSVTITGGSVKALASDGTTIDSIDPRPTNDSDGVELCKLIPVQSNAKVLVDGVDYKVAGPHEEDAHYYLYMTKASHKVTVTNDSKTETYVVHWDKENEEFEFFSFGDLETDNITGVEYSDNELILGDDNQTYTVTMRDGITETKVDRIKVTGKNVTVKLDDVKIDVSSKRDQAALLIAEDASATIDLVGENELKSGLNCAGVQNNNDTENSLVITSGGGEYERYAGKLTATGGDYAAGIGGGYQGEGMVTIHGGEITATGGDETEDGRSGGAGIGGGYKRGGKVAIAGGKITATGGKGTSNGHGGGSGIGGGYTSSGEVTITGGMIIATGDALGSGIGGGSKGSGTVTINSGQITAFGGFDSAGIGGGNYGAGKVIIKGGEITATGGKQKTGQIGGGSGIGSGIEATGEVTITGGTITATGGYENIGIGNGYNGKAGSVTITGGSVKALDHNQNPDSITPRPTSDGNTPIELYRANASSYSTGQSLKVGTKDWPIAGKHAEDDFFYLYLPKEKHVVTVGEQENFIDWQNEAFAPVPTYSLMIPSEVTLTNAETATTIELTNEFHGVAGYNKQVTTRLLNGSYLVLKNQADNKKQVQSAISYQPVVLPHDSERRESILKLDAPEALDESPIQAGNYQGQLTFKTTLATEEGNP